jgi:hypothetical protein
MDASPGASVVVRLELVGRLNAHQVAEVADVVLANGPFRDLLFTAP